MPVRLLLSIHEGGGVFQGEKVFPGLTSKEVRDIIPDIEIPEDAQISETEGWCRMEKVEGWKEMYERCKEVMR